MGVDKNIIAIELGSSSIRGIIGQRKPDGSLKVLGYEKEHTPDCIRKGVVYNIDKTIQAISAIVNRISDSRKVYVKKVYVGVSGQSLRTVGNKVTQQFEVKTAINDEIVDSLMDTNRAQGYQEAEILDVLPQEYNVGGRLTIEPVGIMTDRIEGLYKNIVARKLLRENIQRCMQGAQLEVADYFISPLLLANYLLVDTEKRSGCALVDFGAETTTVIVFEKNILRHLVVIPLGGNNITMDLANSLQIEFDEAEELKLRYGSAYTKDEENPVSQPIELSNDRKTDLKTVLNIIEARQQEILENVWNQIKSYEDRLLAGVFCTGGAANMKNLDVAFAQYLKFDKVKTRIMPSVTDFTTSLKLDTQTNTLATLIAMLRKGDQECTSEKPVEPELFQEPIVEVPQTPAQPTTIKTGEGVVTPPVAEVKPEPETSTPEPESASEPESTTKGTTEPATEKVKKPGAFKRLWNSFTRITETIVEEK